MRALCTVLLIGLLCSQQAWAATEKCPTGKAITPSVTTQDMKQTAFACFKRASTDKADEKIAPADLAKKVTGVTCKKEIENWNTAMMKDVEKQCGSSMKPAEMLPHLTQKLTEWITVQISGFRKQK